MQTIAYVSLSVASVDGCCLPIINTLKYSRTSPALAMTSGSAQLIVVVSLWPQSTRCYKVSLLLHWPLGRRWECTLLFFLHRMGRRSYAPSRPTLPPMPARQGPTNDCSWTGAGDRQKLHSSRAFVQDKAAS